MMYTRTDYSLWFPHKNNKIGVTDKKSASGPATFQKSLRVTLVVGQVFSLIPVNGVVGDSVEAIKFTWKSWKCVYTLLSLLGQAFITVMCIYKSLNTKTTLNGTTPIIFYSTTCLTMMMLVRVAQQWPQLIQHITRTEKLDPNSDSGLTYRCNLTCAVVLSMSLLEHILSLLSAMAGTMLCRPHQFNYEGYVRHSYPWVFDFLPYYAITGIMTQFLHVQSTFIWNFSDLFVICVSYYLTSRLENINRKLLAVQGKYLAETFWRTTREDYSRASQLVREVDRVISGIIFISFANNLFFICLQLFNTLDDGISGSVNCNGRMKGTSFLSGHEAAMYFTFSLTYLIARSVAVSLIVSQVNTASTVPASVLYDVPSPVYCVEVQRFLDQVTGESVALSGLQFFNVTRGLLLTVAGSIVTYELVMLQFNTSSQEADDQATTTTTMLINATFNDYASNFTLI